MEIPQRIAQLPRDERGLPIPRAVLVDKNGVPDFRVIDIQKWLKLLKFRCCGICGCYLGPKCYFVGGPMAIESKTFHDLPMHEECARYALATCPYLALPKFGYAKRIEHPDVQLYENPASSSERPEKFGLMCGRTDGLHARMHPEQGWYIMALGGELVEWFTPGNQTSPDSGEVS